MSLGDKYNTLVTSGGEGCSVTEIIVEKQIMVPAPVQPIIVNCPSCSAPSNNCKCATITSTGAMKVDGSAVTQPVAFSGVVTTTVVDSEGDSVMDDANDALRVNVVAGGAGGGIVTVDNAAGVAAVNIQDGGNSITVDGAVVVSGTVDTELPAQAALADNTANPTTTSVGALGLVWDGASWDRAPGTSVDGALVNLGANNDVTVTGTVTANAGTGTFVVGDGGGSLTVDGSVGVTGTVDTELPAAAALADNTANPTTTSVGALGLVYDGATWDRAPGNSVDGALVNLGANNDVAVTGTVTTTIVDSVGDSAMDDVNNAVRVNIVAGGGGGGGGTSIVDDAPFTVAVTALTPVGGMFDDSAPDSIDEGDAGVFRMSANRNLYSTIRDAAGNERGVNVSAGNALLVDGSAATQPISGTVTANAGTGTFVVDGSAVTQPVSGTVTANAGAGTFVIGDGGSSISVDDNGGSLTVDGSVGIAGTVITTIVDSVGDSAMDDVNNALRVNIIAGAGSGGTAMVDDAAFTVAVTSINPIGAMFDDVAPDSIDEGDAGVVRMSANRNLYSTIRDAAGNERGANVTAANALVVDGSAVIQPVSGTVTANAGTGTFVVGDGGGSITVDGTVGVSGTVDTELPAAAALADNAANPTVPAVGAFGMVYDGATWDRAPGNSTDGTLVNLGTNNDVTITGTVTATLVDSVGDSVMDDANNAVRVNIVAGGGGGSGGTSMVDDAAFTVGTTSITPMGAMFDDVAPDSVDEGDGGVVRMSANRNLYSTIRDAAGNERGVNVTAANALLVDGSAVTQPVSGTVTANAGTNLDTSLLALESGGNLATIASAVNAEDTASANLDKGIPALAVRKLTPANTSGTDGDYEFLQMSVGRLWVSATITSLVPGTTSTTLGKAQDSVAGATDTGVALLAVRDDALSTITPIDGDYALLRTDSEGALWVHASGTVATELPAAAALADNTANPTVPAVGAFGMLWDGATWDRSPGTAADGTLVNLGANNDVTVTSGSITVANAAGASAVNIQDGGNSITVDGTITANAGTGTFTVGDGGASISVDDNGGSLTVDGSVAITGAVDTELPAAVALADNTATPTAPAVGAFGMLWDGATWDRSPGTSADGTLVNLGANNDVTVTSGSITVANASGASAVNIQDGGNSITVDGSVSITGTATVADNQTITDNAAFTDGTSKVFMAGYVFDEVAGTALTENDAAAARVNANRAQIGIIEDSVTRGRYATVNSVNALQVGIVGATGGTANVVQPTDGGSSANGVLATNYNQIYNGTTYDRTRSVIAAQDSIGTGIQAAGILGQLDDTSTATVTENQFAPVRISSRRALLIEGVASGTAVASSQSGTWTVQPGNTPNTTPWLVTQTPLTSGGLTTFHLVSAASTNPTSVKASAGQVFGWYIYNSNAAARKIAFHNTAGAPTAGAAVFMSIVIPPGSAANVEYTNGIPFSTGIAITTVTGLADADATAVALNDLVINIFFK